MSRWAALGICALVLLAGCEQKMANSPQLKPLDPSPFFADDSGARPEIPGTVATDTDLTPKPPWRERKEAYLEHLITADRSTQLVSAADKLHNVRSLAEDYRTAGEEIWARFNGGREGTLWYYRAVFDRLEKLVGSTIHDQLRRAIEELEQLSSA